MSASTWEWLWNGDVDVASPFVIGAVSRCAPSDVIPRARPLIPSMV